jgi:ABC transporter substrate binding protein
LQALSNEHVQAVIVLVDGMFFQERKRIAQLAASARLPAVYGFREHVDAGGLISFGLNLADNFRRAATYVVKILKGAKPGDDLAVEFPNKRELIINLNTSKALEGRSFADTCQRPLCAQRTFAGSPFLTLAVWKRRRCYDPLVILGGIDRVLRCGGGSWAMDAISRQL